MTRLARVLPALCLVAPALGAQQLPPVRPLGATVARSTEDLGSAGTVRALPNGNLLVNDIIGRRLLMFDSTLSKVTVVADSISNAANSYGTRPGGLIPFRGDSTLFVDIGSLSMLVIDPEGKPGRVMSAPRAQDAASLIGGPNGTPGFDPKGRLVYRGSTPIQFKQTAGGPPMGSPVFPDSAPIVRFDLASRTMDTAAFVKLPKPNVTISQNANGGVNISTTQNPMPIIDDWTLMGDGTIAVVRGRDYHIDWVGMDNAVASSAKIPYEWQRLDDETKQMVLDSAKTALEKQRDIMMQRMQGGTGANSAPAATKAGMEAQQMVIVTRGGGAGDAAPPTRGGAGPATLPTPTINMVPISDLPDYRPAFTGGSSIADLDGNVWVKTTSPVGNAGPIYYVINRQNQVIDRVQVPESRVVAGFGSNGRVFLSLRDAAGNVRVERAKLK